MKIFINDKSVKITGMGSEGLANSANQYDLVLNSKDELLSKALIGKVLIYNATHYQIQRFIRLTEVKKLKSLESITFVVADEKITRQFFKDHFKIVKAAGGVVVKGDKVLMINRLKKWDLPKGKLKKKEDSLRGAKREVEEECNIKVEVKERIGATWHSYTQKGKKILKKTDWYEMTCIDDSHMKPQLKEFIEEVKWMDKKDVKKALKNSYRSIEAVFFKFSKDYSL